MFTPSLITRLYGAAPDSATFLLLHHRAALFLAIFVVCVWAMFDPGTRRLASVVVAISMMSFLVLYWFAGSPKPLRNIAVADMIGLPVLLFAALKAFGTATLPL